MDKYDDVKPEERASLLGRSLITGFAGGLLWGFFGFVMYYFNFSEVTANSYLLRSWLTADWTEGWLGHVISILLIGVLSILVALIYFAILKKINSIWIGVFYGLILWGLVFYVLQPIFYNVPKLVDLNKDTIISTLSLFVMYGTFIGYSISFDYHDTRIGNEQNTSRA